MRGGLGRDTRVAGSAGAFARSPAPAYEPPAAFRPDLLLYAVAAVIMTYVWRLQDVVPVLAIARPTTLLLGVAVIAAILRADVGTRLHRVRSPLILCLALLLILSLVGAPFGLDARGTTRFVVSWMIPGALIAALIVVSARGLEDVEWIALVTLVGGLGYALIMYATRPVDEFGRWTTLVYYDANDLALVLVGLVPLSLYFMRPGELPWRRPVGGVCFVVQMLAIVRTGSRGGFLGIGVVLAYLIVTYRVFPGRARMWGAVAAVVVFAAGGPRYWERIRSMLEPSRDYNWSQSEYTGRGALWRRGLGYAKQRPLVGVGANGFVTAERQLSDVARRRVMAGKPVQALVSHSTYIQVAAELGLPGLVLFFALLLLTARTLAEVERRAGDGARAAAFAHALRASLLGYVVCALFLSAAYFAFFYLLLGLAAATAAVGADAARPRRRPAPIVPPAEIEAISSLAGAVRGTAGQAPRAQERPAGRGARGQTPHRP